MVTLPYTSLRTLRVNDYTTMILSIYSSTALVRLGRFYQFLNLYRVVRTPWTGDQPIARPLPTHRKTQT
jgi:hypothetical protein